MSLSMKEEGMGGGGGGAPRAPADLTPFEGMESKWLKGIVARTAPFGIFVTVKKETGETADGLVHITQIRDGFVENAEDEAEVGQEVDVWIQSVDTFAGKMSLSMKGEGMDGGGGGAPRAPADLTPFEGMESKWLKGTVARTAPFGIFVTVKKE